MKVWTLGPVAEGKRINITFLHFNIMPCGGCTMANRCTWDYFEMENVKYCDTRSEAWSLISSTNTVNVKFKSDNSWERSGFFAVWKATN